MPKNKKLGVDERKSRKNELKRHKNSSNRYDHGKIYIFACKKNRLGASSIVSLNTPRV